MRYGSSKAYRGIPGLSLRHLKAVLSVASHRNVSRASEALNRSQAAISKAIAELEQQLGVQLFSRTPTGVAPTVYGEALNNRVALASAEFEAAGASFAEFRKTDRSDRNGPNYRNNPLFSMNISYKRLAALIEVYDQRDFSSAAQTLGISTSAVYKSIREIENLLDVPLFEKDPSGINTTPYCNILVRHVKQAFSQIRHAINEIESIHSATAGHVAIGTLPYSRTMLTPRAINLLLKSQPQIDVTTVEGPYDSLVAQLRSGDIDLVIGALRSVEDSPFLKTEYLLEDELALIARPGHPLAKRKSIPLKALEKLQWVLPAPGTPSRALFERFCEKHRIAQPLHFVETSSLSMVRGLLLESDRVALLSEHQIYHEKKYGGLVRLPISMTGTYRSIGATMLSHTHLSPAAQLFLDCIRSVAKELQQ